MSKTIAVITETLSTGGMPALIELEARSNPNDIYHIFSLTDPGRYRLFYEWLEQLENVTLHVYNGHSASNYATIAHKIKTLGVSFAVQQDTAICTELLKTFGIWVVRWIHSTYQLDETQIIPFAHQYLCVSSTVYEHVRKMVFDLKDHAKLSWLETPVDTKRFNPESFDRAFVRRSNSLSPEDFIFLHVGTWNHNKNQAVMLEIYERFRARYPKQSTRLIFLGALAENFKDYWEPFIARYQNRDDVWIMNAVGNPEIYYALADIFVSTSFEEGNPLAPREAAVMVLPLVVSDIQAHKAIFGDKANMASLRSQKSCMALDFDSHIGEIYRHWRDNENRFEGMYGRKTYYRHRSTATDKWNVDRFIKEMHRVYDEWDQPRYAPELSQQIAWATESKEGQITVEAYNDGDLPVDVNLRILNPVHKTYWEMNATVPILHTAEMIHKHGTPGYVPFSIYGERGGHPRKARDSKQLDFVETLDILPEIKVAIILDSKALGDTLAWLPACIAFQIQHQCLITLVISHLWIKLVERLTDGRFTVVSYDERKSLSQNHPHIINIGWYDKNHRVFFEKKRFEPRAYPLASTATKLLSVDENELPGLAFNGQSTVPGSALRNLRSAESRASVPRCGTFSQRGTPAGAGSSKRTKSDNDPPNKPYICISEYATTKGKMWQRKGAWQSLVDYLTKGGYTISVISKEATTLKSIVNNTGDVDIILRANQLADADAFIGMSSGLAWLAHAVDCHVFMLNTATYDWNEFQDNVTHISMDRVCRGCWNEPMKWELNKAHDWCPSSLDFQCSRLLTPEYVYAKIDSILETMR